MTQGQLAIRARVDRSWVSLLERGGIDEPGSDKLSRIGRVFGKTADYLLSGRGNGDPDPRLDAQLGEFRGFSDTVRDFLIDMGRRLLDSPGTLYSSDEPPPDDEGDPR